MDDPIEEYSIENFLHTRFDNHENKTVFESNSQCCSLKAFTPALHQDNFHYDVLCIHQNPLLVPCHDKNELNNQLISVTDGSCFNFPEEHIKLYSEWQEQVESLLNSSEDLFLTKGSDTPFAYCSDICGNSYCETDVPGNFIQELSDKDVLLSSVMDNIDKESREVQLYDSFTCDSGGSSGSCTDLSKNLKKNGKLPKGSLVLAVVNEDGSLVPFSDTYKCVEKSSSEMFMEDVIANTAQQVDISIQTDESCNQIQNNAGINTKETSIKDVLSEELIEKIRASVKQKKTKIIQSIPSSLSMKNKNRKSLNANDKDSLYCDKDSNVNETDKVPASCYKNIKNEKHVTKLPNYSLNNASSKSVNNINSEAEMENKQCLSKLPCYCSPDSVCHNDTCASNEASHSEAQDNFSACDKLPSYITDISHCKMKTTVSEDVETVPKKKIKLDEYMERIKQRNSEIEKKTPEKKRTICVDSIFTLNASPLTPDEKWNRISHIQDNYDYYEYSRNTRLSSSSSSCSSLSYSSKSRKHCKKRYSKFKSDSKRICSPKYCHTYSYDQSHIHEWQRQSSPDRVPYNRINRYCSNFRRANDKQVEERKVVYVGCLADGTTKEQLRKRFEKFGQIADISVHFREHGDNYGFVTYQNKSHAYKAVEHGNDDKNCPKYDLCFGGRRAFCKVSYSDLDAQKNDYYSDEFGNHNPTDFDSLLKSAMRRKL